MQQTHSSPSSTHSSSWTNWTQNILNEKMIERLLLVEFSLFFINAHGLKIQREGMEEFPKNIGHAVQEWCCFLLIYFWGSLFPPLPIPSVCNTIRWCWRECRKFTLQIWGWRGGGQFFKLSLFKYLKGRADMRKNIYFFNDAMFTKPLRNFFFFFFFSTFTWFRHIFYWNVNCLSKTNKFCVKWLKWLISCNFHRLFLKTNLFSSTFLKNEPNFTDFILFSLTFHQFLEIFSNFSQKWTKFQQLFSKMKQISPTFEHFCGKKSQFWSKWTNFVKNKPNVTAFLQIFIDFS